MTRARLWQVVEILFGMGLAFLVGAVAQNWILDAWAQARTVMYKDYQQTVEVPHIYNTDTPGPPLTVEGNSLGVPATGFAPDMLGNSPVADLPPAGTAGRTRRLSDGGATGATVLDDGTQWTCGEAKSLKVAIVTCPPFNATGDGSTDDAAAIQAALDGGGEVLLPKGTGAYRIRTPLTITVAHTTLRGAAGATIKLGGAVNLPMLDIGAVDGVTIAGLVFDGNASEQTIACADGCRGIIGSSPTNLRIVQNTITNTKNDAIRLSGATTVQIAQNIITDVEGTGIYGAGVLFAAPSNRFITVAHNTLARLGGLGIAINTGKDSLIANNVLFDTGKTITQQAIVAGYGAPGSPTDAERILVTGNVIHTTTLHGCIRVGGQELTVSNNTMTNCHIHGISAVTANDGATYGRTLRLLNNTIVDPEASITALDMRLCNGCEISGNRVKNLSTSTATALLLNTSTNGVVANNTIEEGGTCIRLIDAINATVRGNYCTGQTDRGIYMTSFAAPNDQVSFVANHITNLDGAAAPGIKADDSAPTNISFFGNTVIGVYIGQTIAGPAGSLAVGNFAPGTICVLASAATINPHGGQVSCERIRVSGTTTITSITAGADGRRLTLEFDAALTVTDGSNLILNGDFTTSNDDTLSLVSNGVQWIETGRSAN